MDAGTAVLHCARPPDESTFAIRDGGSVEQFHQVGHEPLPKHCPGLEQRSQILDKLTAKRVADHRYSHSPRDWPICFDAEFREDGFTENYGLADLNHGLLPF